MIFVSSQLFFDKSRQFHTFFPQPFGSLIVSSMLGLLDDGGIAEILARHALQVGIYGNGQRGLGAH